MNAIDEGTAQIKREAAREMGVSAETCAQLAVRSANERSDFRGGEA